MYRAVLVLFSATAAAHPGKECVYSAIRMLEDADYLVDNTHRSFQKTLLDAMEKVDCDDLSQESREFLEDGIDILTNRLANDSI
jgi:hypothetical protein